MAMWKGYEARRRDVALPFAIQTFHTTAMFSKDIRLEDILRAFGCIDDDAT